VGLIVAVVCTVLVVIAGCSLILALALRVSRLIRDRFAESRELALCLLVTTWSLFGAVVVMVVGACASGFLTS